MRGACLGASAFGAGFGGSVYALVDAGVMEPADFKDTWAAAYAARWPDREEASEFFVVNEPAPGAALVWSWEGAAEAGQLLGKGTG